MKDELKQELGIEESKKIPSDFNVPYLVHQDDMNKMDMSHRRVEKWLFVLCLIMFIALIGTNAYWIWNESQYEDVVTETFTAETDQGGTAIANGNGSVVVNGESDLYKND